jgi:cell division transport system permease protein
MQSDVEAMGNGSANNQTDEIMRVIRSTNGIKSVNKLQESDILKIIEPWLSGTSIPDDFPFPIIFDVEYDENVRMDLLLLAEKLSKISPGVKIHDHANWYVPIMKISNCLFFFAVLLSAFVFATMCATIIFITKKTLVAHESVEKILQLIGADNFYIASQFNRHYFGIGCRASLISMIVGISTVLWVNYMSSIAILSPVTVSCMAIAVLIPLLAMGIIMITARKSVIFFLNNDGWID